MVNKNVVEISDEAMLDELSFERIKLRAMYDEIVSLSIYNQRDLVTAKLNKEVDKVKEITEIQENLDNQAYEVLDELRSRTRLMNSLGDKLGYK